MSKLIILYNYNKYYNRIIKKLDTFAEYQALITPGENTPALFHGFKLDSKNFDMADGVYTKHVVNVPKTALSFYKMEQPDYIIQSEFYVDGDAENPVVTEKITRWFVLEANRIRGNQYELSLRRDLLADYYSEVLQAPVFVERGYPTNYSDPAIFNKEGFTFNQIKKNEFLLNNTRLSGNGGGWIVGYLARQETETPTDKTISGFQEPPKSGYVDFENLSAQKQAIINAGGADVYNVNDFALFIFSLVNNQSYSIGLNVKDYTEGEIEEAYFNAYEYPADLSPGDYSEYLKFDRIDWTPESASTRLVEDYQGSVTAHVEIKEAFDTWFNNEKDITDLSSSIVVEELNGVIYKKNNRYYRIEVDKTNNSYPQLNPNSVADGFYPKHQKNYTISQIKGGVDNLALQIKTYINNHVLGGNTVIENPSQDQSKIGVCISRVGDHYRVRSVEVTTQPATVLLSKDRNKLYDAPYDMFCIPYGNVTIKQNNSTLCVSSGNVALPLARAAALLGSSFIYDIQILPYCPFEEVIDSQGNIDLTGFTVNQDYNLITEQIGGQNVNVSVLLYPKSCKGTFDLNITSSDDIYEEVISSNLIEDRKVKSETQIVRFVSPNFASIYEINAQKNNGITSLNVDYFYKPYSPYIHVAPYFSGLYGQDFNDPKGLVCSGDFSIATASSKWEEYQIQNKNYENIFNRSIQNLDVNNRITYEQQRIASGISVASTAITGALGGAVTGFLTGGPVGALAGGVAGGAVTATASAIGRKYDLQFLRESQSEARSYSVDMYTYQLGNIQALPNTLTKVSAFTTNNKIFPFLEIYDCTNEEKETLRNKIRYNGMTIMRIGTISEFRGGAEHFVQGQLIRLATINEDSHVVAEIAKELKEGAYFYGYDTVSS